MAFSNIFHYSGRRWVNQILNGQIARPSTLYLGLRTLNGVGSNPSDATLADTLTSNLTEVGTGLGYARIAITFNNTNFVESLSSPDSILTVAAQTFTFTGTVSGVTHSFLCTSSDNSGVLICSAAIPAAVVKNFGSGDTYQVTAVFAMGTHA